MRKFLLATTAIWAGVAGPVYAQESAERLGDEGIDEIVVTAQKKEESLQDAALAIDAVSGADLLEQGVVNARDITKLVPSLTIANGGGQNSSLFLRGVGNRTNNAYNDPAIAISYDGVYVARPAALTGAAFYDLQRVEVLKGPQGILYGRNATGGALNILPNKPKLGDRAAGFFVSYGSFDAVNANGYVNLPVGDSVAVRLAASRQVQDGINRDGSDDRNLWSTRGQILFEPSDAVSVRLGGDYTKVGGRGPGNHYLGSFSAAPAFTFIPGPFDLYEGMGTDAANAYRRTLRGAPGFGLLRSINQQTYIDMEYWGVNGELNAKTGIGTVTVIAAYRADKGSSAFNGPAFNTAINFVDDSQFTLEARLAGSAGPVDYIVGAFYMKDDAFANNEFNQEFVLPIQRYDHTTKSVAGFGQATFNVSDRIRLLGGLRYTKDTKSMDGLITNFITFCGAAPPGNLNPGNGAIPRCSGAVDATALPRYPNFLDPQANINWLIANNWIAPTSTLLTTPGPPRIFPLLNGRGVIQQTYSPVNSTRKFDRWTWKGSAEFDVAEDNLLYATYETGYRAGGLQLAEGRPTYEPEYLDSFTLGSKNRFFDNKVQINLEAFWWKYKDQQITYFTVDTSGTLINSNENAGRVDIKGIEADLIFKPTRNTTVSAKYAYLDSQYKDLHLYTAAPRDNLGCPFTLVTYGSNPRYPATTANPAGTQVRAGGQPVKDFNCSGNQGVFAPKWTINLGVEQVVPMGSALELVGRVDTAWRGSQWGGFEFLAFERIPSYWTTDASITLRDVEGGWSLSAYALNLENKRRFLFPQQSPIGPAVTTVSAPRSYGMRLSADF
jgi:iron complex outermembrane recepter protein